MGLRLLCLSDTHDYQLQLPGAGGPDALPKADILVHGGDFSMRGTSDEVASFRDWMVQLLDAGTVRQVVVVAGNHELTFDPSRLSKRPDTRARQQALKADLAAVPNITCESRGLRAHGGPDSHRLPPLLHRGCALDAVAPAGGSVCVCALRACGLWTGRR